MGNRQGTESVMRENVFFSVIIPAYNAERFIAETLQSVLAQTYSDFEVIIVDDESRDGTSRVVQDFLFDRRVSAYAISHQGKPAAVRNHALRYAKGRYVAFLDADDLWAVDKLEQYYNHIERTGAGFLFSNGINIDTSGKQIGMRLNPRMKRLFPIQDPLLLYSNIVGVSSVAVKRDLLRPDQFSAMEEVRAVEDYRVWLELNLGTEIHYLSDPLFYYRIHNNQISASHLFMLDQMENVLAIDGIGLASSHGGPLISLARQLISVRRMILQKMYFKAFATLAALLRTMNQRERSTFWEYLHYGLGQNMKNMMLQRLKKQFG
jgi:glycosyltransferase involved in cell wall biosynthesis